MSKFTEPKKFWLDARNPSKSSTLVALVLGSLNGPSPISTNALGSSDPALKIPLGRWYLKDLPTILTLLATRAEANVSPL